jgi:hypothetical protein
MAKADLRKRTLEEIPKNLQDQMKSLFDRRVELKDIETDLEVEKKENSKEVMSIMDELEIDQVLSELAMYTVKFSPARMKKENLVKALTTRGVGDPSIIKAFHDVMETLLDKTLSNEVYMNMGIIKKFIENMILEDILEESMGELSDVPYLEFRLRNGKTKK